MRRAFESVAFVVGFLVGGFASVAAVIVWFLESQARPVSPLWSIVGLFGCVVGFTVGIKKLRRRPTLLTGLLIGLVSGPVIAAAYALLIGILVLSGMQL